MSQFFRLNDWSVDFFHIDFDKWFANWIKLLIIHSRIGAGWAWVVRNYMTIWTCSISHILLHYIYLSSGQQQLSTNRKKIGTLSGDFTKYLTVIPDRLCMTSYAKKRFKVTLVRFRKPEIGRYESCMTLNQKVNNIRKSH